MIFSVFGEKIFILERMSIPVGSVIEFKIKICRQKSKICRESFEISSQLDNILYFIENQVAESLENIELSMIGNIMLLFETLFKV
jgi:hypothetical protein